MFNLCRILILCFGFILVACSAAENDYAELPEPEPYVENDESAEKAKARRKAAEEARRKATQQAAPGKGILELIDAAEKNNDPVDTALAELRTYPIAYETPDEAQQGRPFDVTLAIDATGDDSAVEGLPQTQNIREAEARLSKYVEASLSGAAFDIKLTNAKRQRLSPVRESVWRWSVTPVREGAHDLYLEIHAIVGENETMLLESFSDTISVTVSAKSESFWGADNIRTYISIIGGIISILLGLIALRSHMKGREKAPNDSEG